MLSDRETTLDALGFEPYVDSLYNVIVSPGITPFTIGIYGKWGTGKTSLMRMLQKKLDEEKKIKTIWFNAWKFEKEKDIWVALIQTLLNEIEVKDESKIEEAKRIIKKLRYGINWIQMAGFVTSIALQKPDFHKLSEALDSNLRDRIESIYDFEKEFEKLVELSGVDLLLVFIDDLDRCKKDATLNILEVMKLFLYSKKCVYVLGLDHEKICKAIASKFPEDVAEEYLDKIVQLPFFIPRIKFENMRKFLRFLVISQYMDSEENMKNLAEKVHALREDEFDLEVRRNSIFVMNKNQLEEYRDIMEQQEIIVDENDYNPRKIKKFLNTYFLRRFLKENLNLKLKNEYIVKFLLLQLKYKGFHKDLERYLNLLNEMQSLFSMEKEEREKELEKSDLLRVHFENKKLVSFLERMEFGDMDTRPYLLLSKTGALPILNINEIEVMEDLILSDDSVRISSAVHRFSKLGKEKKEYFIKMILQDTHGIIKNDTIDTIAAVGAPAVDLLLTFLEKTDNDLLRRSIIEALGRIKDPKAVDLLLTFLEKTDNDLLRRSIIEALGEIGGSKVDNDDLRLKIVKNLVKIGDKVVDPLIDLLEKTDNDSLKLIILEALGKIKDPKAVDPLIDLLEKTGDDNLRNSILKALGRIGDKAVDPLIDLLEKTGDDNLRNSILSILKALGKIGDKAVDPLIDLLEKTGDDNLRNSILEALGKIGDKAVDPLIDLLEKTGDDNLRNSILEALGKIKDPKAVDPLIDLLEKTDNDSLKLIILEALGKIKDPKAVDPLIDLLEKTGDDNLRRGILEALGKIKDPKAVDPLIGLLQKTDNDSLKLIILEALGKIKDPKAVDPLIGLLQKTDNDEERNSILETLGEIGNKAIDPLIALLKKTENYDVRKSVSESLVRIGDKAIDPLIALLGITDNENLRRRILETLAKIKDPKAVNPLLTLWKFTDDYDLKTRILKVLVEIGDKAVNPLVQFLEGTGDHDLRLVVLEALGNIGDPKAVDPLLNLLQKTDDNVLEKRISEALGNIGDPKAVDPLLNLLQKTPHVSTREIVKKALYKIEKKNIEKN